MRALGDLGGALLAPLYDAIAAVLVGWHHLLTATFGLSSSGGLTWALSIIGLTVVVRAALIPLFLRQIRAGRALQQIQPRIRQLEQQHGHDRERLAAETMALYRETGINPMASCLPLLVQTPILLALFRLVDHAADRHQSHGLLTRDLARSLADSRVFGVVPIQASLTHPGGVLAVPLVAGALVLAMTVTTFLTQRQVSANLPADAHSGPSARRQRTLLLVLPLVFAIGGLALPIGVLLYWTTSSLWTAGQQCWVIRHDPAPGTPGDGGSAGP